MMLHHKSKKVMMLTGEASGDLHGAKLVRALREIDDTISFFGTGGKALEKEGVELFFDIKSLSVMGLTEVFSKLHLAVKALFYAKRLLKEQHPDLLILIDFPEFNLNVAKTAKKLGVPVLYYISPKVWAWRSGRVKTIKKRVDHLAIILPFEREFYRKFDVPFSYVGHPLLDTLVFQPSDRPVCDEQGGKLIALLPGSREKEILGVLPQMMEAAKILSKDIQKLKFLVSAAPSIDRRMIDEIVSPYSSVVNFDVTSDQVDDIFKAAVFAMAASGTVTLEAAIAGIPMIVVYRMSAMSYFFARHLVKLKYACLVNLIAGSEVVPELLQDDANPELMAATVKKIITDENAFNHVKAGLAEVKAALGGPGASDRVAEIALEMMT